MKSRLSRFTAKVQNFFQRKKVVEKLKDDYNTSTIQSIKNEILIQMWNNGFPNEAVDIYENGKLTISEDKFKSDIQVFINLFILMLFSLALLMLINFYNK
ncbi:hypothetical protein [Chishuiella sp.]|uniref:hypothetical protein n=1 Tax=Chishuiella sp. TaxID=1969467 RepID=UPI0028A96858|nr:hypothetical protein [Chishuiella sp.]